MKKNSLKTAFITAIAITVGVILYEGIFKDSINWLRSLFMIVFVAVALLVINKFSGKK